MRQFYNENFDLGIPNYARPMRWWDHGMNLYMEAFYDHGFRVLNVHPSQWRIGDGLMMAISSPVANHSGVFVAPGQVLHHLIGCLSRVSPYRGLLRNRTVAVLRHKDIDTTQVPEPLDLMELLPHVLRTKLASVMPPAGGPE